MSENTKQVTIYDVSQVAGVSIATVSRVLNDSPSVSEATKVKIRAVMDELDYEPNAFARGLGTGSMKTIGILCADVTDIYLANAVSFLQRDLRSKGFDSVLHCTGYDYESKRKSMKIMEGRRVDAVIMVGSQYIERINKKNDYILETSKTIPVMLVNGYLDGDNIYCNLSDDYEAFYDATIQLIEKGSRKIMFLFRELSYSRNNKWEGYKAALAKYGLALDESLILQSNNSMQFVKEDIAAAKENGLEFDAIIACDDELAIGALKYAKEYNLKIPNELSVIGCNNSVLSICSRPELSSIDNMCEQLCSNTVNMLMRVLDHQCVAKKVVVSTRLVKRETTRQ